MAISIMTLLGVMSWRGLDAMTNAQLSTKERSDTVQALQAGLGQWNADWDALIQWTNGPTVDWNGKALRMIRPAPNPAIQGVVVVAWSERKIEGVTQWLRWQSPVLQGRQEIATAWLLADHWAQNPTEDEKRGELAITPLSGWQIFYFRENAWSNPFSSAGSGSSSAPTLPDGVRLVLTLPPTQALSGKLTRDWVRAAVAGNKS